MDDLLTELARARLAWVSPRLREWYDDARLVRQLASGLADEAGRVGDVVFGAEFRDGVGIDASADPLDWANRRIDLPTGGWAVAGIRFRGLDVTRPFVDVVATTEPPTPDGLAVGRRRRPPVLRLVRPAVPAGRRAGPGRARGAASPPTSGSGHGARSTSTSSRGRSPSCAVGRARRRTTSSRCGPATRPPSPSGPPPSTPSSRGATPTC